MAYAAYLRICEPVSAFHEPDRSRWAAYATYACPPGRVRARRGHIHARPWPMACIRRIRAGELSTRRVRGGISPGVGTAPAGSGRVVARGAGRALGGLRPILAGQLLPNLARCDDKYRETRPQ